MKEKKRKKKDENSNWQWVKHWFSVSYILIFMLHGSLFTSFSYVHQMWINQTFVSTNTLNEEKKHFHKIKYDIEIYSVSSRSGVMWKSRSVLKRTLTITL